MKPEHLFAKNIANMILFADALGYDLEIKNIAGRRANIALESKHAIENPQLRKTLANFWQKVSGIETDLEVLEG